MDRLADLYNRFITDTATAEEVRDFWALTAGMPDDHPLQGTIYALYTSIEVGKTADIDWSVAEQKIFEKEKEVVPLVKRGWFRYAAAAAMIVIAIGIYKWNAKKLQEEPAITQTNPNPVKTDIAPGGSRATLTLADGRTIRLDEAGDGIIAEQGDINIQKISDKILYPSVQNEPSVGSKVVAFNTMSTPRGGQYQLQLPDGTKVWLNAESSITYPIAFTERERRVTVTGEVYFEVSKDKRKPFKVLVRKENNISSLKEESTAGSNLSSRKEKNIPSLNEGSRAGSNELEIEVLGTHFNVNAYNNETTVKTTLIEGRVRITNKNSVLTSIQLKPGQQGQFRNGELTLAANPDMDQVMAWQKGLFDLKGLTFQEFARQLERWYDIEVRFEGAVPHRTFMGKLSRHEQLSTIVNWFSGLQIRNRLEGRTLTFSGN